MTDIADNIWLILGAALIAALLAWLIYRSARRSQRRAPILSERAADERPYLRSPAPPPAVAHDCPGMADEVAHVTTHALGEMLRVDTHHEAAHDDLKLLKGVGPKLAARLAELGISSYAQLAGLSATEVTMLDERLGPFSGRVARDRLVEQAHYLARGDTDGFEARFGKLGG